MKSHLILIIIACFVCTGAMALRSSNDWIDALEAGVDYVPGEILVKLKANATELNPDHVFEEYSLGRLREKPLLGWYKVAVPQNVSRAVPCMIQTLEKDPRIQSVTPNYYRYLEWEPDDYYWQENHLWNFRLLGMPDAWEADSTPPKHGGDPNTIIAVVDSGCAYKNWTDTENYNETVQFAQAPDFENLNYWINPDEAPENGIDDDQNGYVDDSEGWNFVFDSPYPCDDEGHGTHVTGTIAQSTDNDGGGSVETLKSAVGMAFECTVMILKTAKRSDGTSTIDDVAEAIVYAADNGADVINLSLGAGYVGFGFAENIEKDACDYAYESGVVVVSSSGNDADLEEWSPIEYGVGFPAGYTSVIAVGASNNAIETGNSETEEKAPFSQYGYTIEVVAPSGWWDTGDLDGSGRKDEIWQQVMRHKAYPVLDEFYIKAWSGTSMACPHVAAEAGLILSNARAQGVELSPMEVRNIINATCVDINSGEFSGYDYFVGFGRIHAGNALTQEIKPKFIYRNATVDESEENSNGNFRPEAGETAVVNLAIMPLFADATNINATIQSDSPYISITKATAQYGHAAGNTEILPVDPFKIHIKPGCPLQHDAKFDVNVTCDEEAVPCHHTFSLRITPSALLFWDHDREKCKYPDLETVLLDVLDTNDIPYEFYRTPVKNKRNQIDPESSEPIVLPWEEPAVVEGPSYEYLRRFDSVIWFMGQGGHLQKNLVNMVLPEVVEYIDHGGNMFLTSHNILSKLHEEESGADDLVWIDPNAQPNLDDKQEYGDYFIYNYLGVAGVEHDDFYNTVLGGDADPLTRGVECSFDLLTYNDLEEQDYYWLPDNLIPRSDVVVSFISGDPVKPSNDYINDLMDWPAAFEAEKPFKAKNNPAGIRFEKSGVEGVRSRIIFLAFPMESMINPAETFVPLVKWLNNGSGENSDTVLVDIDTNLAAITYNDDWNVPSGDPLTVYGITFNPYSQIQAQRWVLLDIAGYYFFWPAWSESVSYADKVIPSGFDYEVFLEIPEWPAGAGNFSGVRFWMTHLSSDWELLGELDVCEFGYY